MLDFPKWSGGKRYTILEDVRGTVRYVGMSSVVNANEADPIWKIFRESRISPTVTRSEWALGDSDAVHVWDDRDTYFTPVSSSNTTTSRGVQYTLCDAASMSSSIEGDEFDVSLCQNWSVQFTWTGTPTGTVSVEATVEGSQYTSIVGSAQTTGATSGSHTVNFGGNGFYKIRPIFTRTSGSGTLTITAIGN